MSRDRVPPSLARRPPGVEVLRGVARALRRTRVAGQPVGRHRAAHVVRVHDVIGPRRRLEARAGRAQRQAVGAAALLERGDARLRQLQLVLDAPQVAVAGRVPTAARLLAAQQGAALSYRDAHTETTQNAASGGLLRTLKILWTLMQKPLHYF